MKTTILAGLFIVATASGAVAADKTITLVADSDYAPFSFENDKGEPDGIYTAILLEAFGRIEGYTVEIKPTPWKRALAMVEKGDVYGIYPPYHNPEGRPYLKSYSAPILAEKFVVVCHPDVLDGQTRDSWPESYYGLRFANQAGFTGPGDEFFAAADRGDLKVSEVRDVQSAIKMIDKKRVDCHANAELPIREVAATLHAAGELGDPEGVIQIGMVIRQEDGYVAYGDDAAFDADGGFRTQLDEVIKAMEAEGRIEEIVNEYLAR